MRPLTETQVRLMYQAARGEGEYGPRGYGVFAPGGSIPGLVKRGLLSYLDTIDDGEGRVRAVYALTEAGRSWLVTDSATNRP